MTIRALVINEEVREAVQKIVDYSTKPANWFRPGPVGEWNELQGSGKRPGDKPEHCILLGISNDIRCVFSYTVAATRADPNARVVVKDLSVAVKGGIVHPILAFEVAELFGFTKREPPCDPAAPGESWQVWLDDCRPYPCACIIEDTGLRDV